MINAYQLSYGDIVKYDDEYFSFLGIHRRYDSKTSELLETYAMYEGLYGIKAQIEDSSIKEVKLTRELLEKIGFTTEHIKDAPEHVFRAVNGKSISIYGDKDGMDIEINSSEADIEAGRVCYLHELQKYERACGLWDKADIKWYLL